MQLQNIAHQITDELRAFWRNPPSAVFAFVAPIVILAFSLSIGGSAHLKGFGSYKQFLIPVVVAFAIIGVTYTNNAMIFVIRRDTGVLKRLYVTPVSTLLYIAGIVGSSLINAILICALLIGGSVVFDSYATHINWLTLIVTVLLGSIAFSCLGILVSAILPNVQAASGILNLTLLPLSGLSALFQGGALGSVLNTILNILPIRALMEAMAQSLNTVNLNIYPLIINLAIILIWSAVSIILAAKFFRVT
jgi:ABC-2 type transport system permease protein